SPVCGTRASRRIPKVRPLPAASGSSHENAIPSNCGSRGLRHRLSGCEVPPACFHLPRTATVSIQVCRPNDGFLETALLLEVRGHDFIRRSELAHIQISFRATLVANQSHFARYVCKDALNCPRCRE